MRCCVFVLLKTMVEGLSIFSSEWERDTPGSKLLSSIEEKDGRIEQAEFATFL